MFYQSQHLGISEYFHKEYGSNFSFPNHLHKSFELITIISGEMDVNVERTLYTIHSYEGVLVFPNQMHSVKSSHSKHIVFIFSSDIIKAYYTKYIHMIPKTNKFNLSKQYLKQLNSLSDDSPMYLKKAVFYSICSEFDAQVEYETGNNSNKDLLYQIFDFVENHYADNCSLDALAKSTSYNYSYLSKYFKEIVKMSYNEYVNRHRISNACYLLDNTDAPILQCAIDCGYNSLRSFNRNFKLIMGVTPRQYKENSKNKSVNNY